MEPKDQLAIGVAVCKFKFLRWIVEEALARTGAASAVVKADDIVLMKHNFGEGPLVFLQHFGSNWTEDCESGMQDLCEVPVKEFIDNEIEGSASKLAAKLMADCVMGLYDDDFHSCASEEVTFSTYFANAPDGETAAAGKGALYDSVQSFFSKV